MTTQLPSRFTSWEFSDQELNSALVFNDFQKKMIQNHQCQIAEQLINIEAGSPEEYHAAELQRSFLKGQLQILAHILELSNAHELQINSESYQTESVARQMQHPEGPNLFTQFRKEESEQSQSNQSKE